MPPPRPPYIRDLIAKCLVFCNNLTGVLYFASLIFVEIHRSLSFYFIFIFYAPLAPLYTVPVNYFPIFYTDFISTLALSINASVWCSSMTSTLYLQYSPRYVARCLLCHFNFLTFNAPLPSPNEFPNSFQGISTGILQSNSTT